jgi:hypothetical protein
VDGEMAAGHRVGGTAQQATRHARVHQRADPARAVRAALLHVTDQPGERDAAVVALDERPEVAQFDFGRRVRARHAHHRSLERAIAHGARDEWAQRAGQQALDRPRSVLLGKEPAVQEAHARE